MEQTAAGRYSWVVLLGISDHTDPGGMAGSEIQVI